MSEPIRLGEIIPGVMDELLKRKTEAERIQIEERAGLLFLRVTTISRLKTGWPKRQMGKDEIL